MTRSVAALTEATLRTFYITRITVATALLVTATAVCFSRSRRCGGFFRRGRHGASAAQEIQGKQEKPRPTEQTGVRADEPQISEIVGKQLAEDFEAALYRVLKQHKEFVDPAWAFKIKVRDVQERALIDATFLHRAKGKVNEYDAVIQAKRAVLHVDLKAMIILRCARRA